MTGSLKDNVIDAFLVRQTSPVDHIRSFGLSRLVWLHILHVARPAFISDLRLRTIDNTLIDHQHHQA
jgi:hypothetical protein